MKLFFTLPALVILLSVPVKAQLATFEKNNKVGLVDKSGKVIVDALYDYIEPWEKCNDSVVPGWFEFGYFADSDSLLRTLPKIASEGIFSREIPEEYSILDIYGNVQFIIPSGKLFGLMDSSGKIILPLIFGESSVMVKNVARVWKIVGVDINGYPMGEWGALDRGGSMIIPMNYEYIKNAYDFSEGFDGFVLMQNGKTLYVDMHGNKIGK